MASKRTENWLGMNWIRQDKRLAIYLRDGLSCAYCGFSVEDGAQLSLDHIVPHSHGGDNSEKNLVTCCKKCNSSRGNRPMPDFAAAVAEYLDHGVKAPQIIRHIHTCLQRPLKEYRVEAKAMIARRGSAAKAIAQ